MVVVVVARGQEGPGERRGWLEVVAQLTDCAVTPELPQSSLTRHRTRTPSPPGKEAGQWVLPSSSPPSLLSCVFLDKSRRGLI